MSPTVQAPAVVTSRVAPEASTANQSSPLSTAVKQMPEVAIEPPSGISASGSRVRDGHAPAIAVCDLEHAADVGDDPGEHDAPYSVSTI